MRLKAKKRWVVVGYIICFNLANVNSQKGYTFAF